MKHIGEYKLAVSIPIGTRTGVTSTRPDAVRCPKCRDAGFLRYDVPVGHPFFGRLSECECKRREKEVRRAADLRRLSNLEAFLEAYDFDAFDPSVEGTEEAYREAVAYARDPTGRWLLLHGNCGAGKTHLAAAIALRVMEQGKSVYFAVVPDLLDHLRSTFDPNSGVAYDQRFDDIRNAWLLVLDDLGTENTTPWAREKLYQIFNHRYNEQLPTVVTSNQDFNRIEERVLSRLLDTRLTRYVHVDTQDYRQRRLPQPGNGRR
jgi:DNA replication protein DnaC